MRAAGLDLSDGRVHLWCVELGDVVTIELSRLVSILPADERAAAERYRFRADRRRFLYRRALLRLVLGTVTGWHPARVPVSRPERGKPAIEDDAGRRGPEFSASSSDDMALVAVCSAPVGVDVERIRPLASPERLAEYALGEDVAADLRSLQPRDRSAVFLRRWTVREAAAKLTGAGLLEPASASGGPCTRTFVPRPGYVATLATHRPAVVHPRELAWPS